MPAPAHLALFALFSAVAPAMAQPLEPEQASLLLQARAVALGYSASLPDFICTEVVRRDHDPMSIGIFGPRDTLTVRLSYFDHREGYTLMLIDGKPTKREFYSVSGAVSTGEFGTRLYSLLHPRSRGDFVWKGWTTLRNRRVGRFGYHIARENSNFLVQNGRMPVGVQMEDLAEGPNAMMVAYHGDVWVDEDTHMALRFTQEAEIPEGFPIGATVFTVDYDFASVGGKRYLLPSHAVVKIRTGRYVAENKVEFRDYHKYHADSSITFDSSPARN
jgi:hypothetical protein